MNSLADRVWFAYHCLPRTGKQQKPPSYRSIESQAGLAGGTFSRLFTGERQNPEPETLVGLGRALGVSLDWLLTGNGNAPTPPGPVPPRLPYLVAQNESVFAPPESLGSLAEAVQLVHQAAKANPNASALELLALAQLEAIKAKK